MPRKQSTQLDEVVSMIKLRMTDFGALDVAQKKAILKDISEKFKCTETTAYYYYFYKAKKVLEAEGLKVMATKEKKVKKTKAEKSTSDLIADLPKPMLDQMKAGNKFSQLMVA
jgi:hypothetical protein